MQQLDSFMLIVTDVWHTGVFSVSVGEIFIAFIILYVFVILRHLVARFLITWLRALTKRTKTTLDDKGLECIEGPLRLLPVTFGIFVAGQYLELEGNVEIVMANIMRSLVAVTIFWSAYNLTEVLSKSLGKAKRVFTPVMVDWLSKTAKVVFVLIGVATVLELWGIEVGPIIAGLGLFGVAVALGAQDLFKNLIAGVLVIAERRFNKGDWVLVDDIVEGTVESIGFRSTVVRRFDKAPVYVPNTKFSDNAVTNFSAMTHRRIYWKIGVEYSTTIEQLKEIRDNIENYILTNDAFAKPSDVSTFVRIDSFNSSSIDIMLYCFTNTTDWGEWLEIKEKFAYHIKDVIEKAGTGFAFPSQSLYVEKLPENRAENFIPPKDTKNKKVVK
tara:strand:- start:113060 stop:114214 length:1155 start_codon:yes stop_codon:yes gene_type:complete